MRDPRIMLILSMAIFGTLGPFVRNISVSSGELALYRAVLAVGLIAVYLLVTKQVSTVPGDAYNLPGKIRFAYANSMENLKEAFDRVEEALALLK